MLGMLKSLARQVEFVLGRMWHTRTLGFNFPYAHNMYSYDIVVYREEKGVLNLQSSDECLERYLILFVKWTYNEFVNEKVNLAYSQESGDIDALMKLMNWDLAFSNGNV